FATVWFNQHRLPRGGGRWFAVVIPTPPTEPPHGFLTSRCHPLARRRFQVHKGREVVVHPVL
ncbi:hypothetical protein A2U01_0029878, partial [Trifolium medium]|nr:hypothetical protein [Trifolium medium]